jgi:hypothetical protein
MISLFERKKIAEATAFNTVGKLPGQFDRVPVVKMKQLRVRAKSASFFVPGGGIAIEGKTYSMDADIAHSVAMRGLAELLS